MVTKKNKSRSYLNHLVYIRKVALRIRFLHIPVILKTISGHVLRPKLYIILFVKGRAACITVGDVVSTAWKLSSQ